MPVPGGPVKEMRVVAGVGWIARRLAARMTAARGGVSWPSISTASGMAVVGSTDSGAVPWMLLWSLMFASAARKVRGIGGGGA